MAEEPKTETINVTTLQLYDPPASAIELSKKVNEALLEQFKVPFAELAALLTTYKITEENYPKTMQTQGILTSLFKNTEAARLVEVAPLNEEVKRINGIYRKIQEAINVALSPLTRLNKDFQLDLEAEQRRKQQEAEAAAFKEQQRQIKKGQVPVTPEPVSVYVPPPPRSIDLGDKTISYRDDWKWNYASEADKNPMTTRIPKQYLVIDEKKISNDVRNHKGQLSIPGVTPYPDKIPVQRMK